MQSVKVLQKKSDTVSETLGVDKKRADTIIEYVEALINSNQDITEAMDKVRVIAENHRELYFGLYCVGVKIGTKRAKHQVLSQTVTLLNSTIDLVKSYAKRARKSDRNEIYAIFVGFAAVATGYFVNVDTMLYVYAGLAWLPMILQALWWMLRMIGKVIVWILAAIYAPFYLVYLLIKRYMRNKRTAEEKA